MCPDESQPCIGHNLFSMGCKPAISFRTAGNRTAVNFFFATDPETGVDEFPSIVVLLALVRVTSMSESESETFFPVT